jgi:hypothetical protein
MSKQNRLGPMRTAMLTALVVALACLPAVAGAAGAGKVRGRTSQGRAVRLAVSHSKLKMLRFTAKLRCRDGSILVDDESGFRPTKVKGGKFSDRQVGSTDAVLFKGKLASGAVRGRLRVRDRVGGTRCDSHWFSFTARIKG